MFKNITNSDFNYHYFGNLVKMKLNLNGISVGIEKIVEKIFRLETDDII